MLMTNFTAYFCKTTLTTLINLISKSLPFSHNKPKYEHLIRILTLRYLKIYLLSTYVENNISTYVENNT